MGFYFFFLAIFMGLIVASLLSGEAGADTEHVTINWLLPNVSSPQTLNVNTWSLLIVISCSAMGSTVHTCASYAHHINNGTLTENWLGFLIMRLPIAISLGLAFYMLLRGGLLGTTNNATPLDSFGLGAMSAMVGMFTQQATNKLRDVFNTLFKTDATPAAPTALQKPSISGTTPATLKAGGGDQDLMLTGQGFMEGDDVLVKGQAQKSKLVSATQRTVTISAADTAAAGEIDIIVRRPAKDGKEADASAPIKVPVA